MIIENQYTKILHSKISKKMKRYGFKVEYIGKYSSSIEILKQQEGLNSHSSLAILESELLLTGEPQLRIVDQGSYGISRIPGEFSESANPHSRGSSEWLNYGLDQLIIRYGDEAKLESKERDLYIDLDFDDIGFDGNKKNFGKFIFNPFVLYLLFTIFWLIFGLLG